MLFQHDISSKMVQFVGLFTWFGQPVSRQFWFFLSTLSNSYISVLGLIPSTGAENSPWITHDRSSKIGGLFTWFRWLLRWTKFQLPQVRTDSLILFMSLTPRLWCLRTTLWFCITIMGTFEGTSLRFELLADLKPNSFISVKVDWKGAP